MTSAVVRHDDASPFDAILFDCDGVLIDSETIATQALHQSLRELSLHYTEAEVGARFTGHSFPDCIAMIEQDLGSPVPQSFLEENTRIFTRLMREQLTTMPGIASVLAELTLPFAVVTNSRTDELTMKLAVAGLDGFFPEHRRFDSQSMGVAKPDPAIYRQSAEHLGFDITRCLVIEDSVPGLTAASLSGATVWAYRPHAAQQVIDELAISAIIQDWQDFAPRLRATYA